MKKRYSLLIATWLMAVHYVDAEEMKSEVTREQRDVEVNSQSGKVVSQQEVQKDSFKKEVSEDATRVERERESASSANSENIHGDRKSVDTQDSTKTRVTTRPDGIEIETKQQNSERVLSE